MKRIARRVSGCVNAFHFLPLRAKGLGDMPDSNAIRTRKAVHWIPRTYSPTTLESEARAECDFSFLQFDARRLPEVEVSSAAGERTRSCHFPAFSRDQRLRFGHFVYANHH
jgi:hypothetical protein